MKIYLYICYLIYYEHIQYKNQVCRNATVDGFPTGSNVIPSEIKEEQQVVVLPLALRVSNLINRFIKFDTLRNKGRTTTLREVSSSGYMKGKKSKYFCPSHLLEFHFSKIILIFYNSNKYF